MTGLINFQSRHCLVSYFKNKQVRFAPSFFACLACLAGSILNGLGLAFYFVAFRVFRGSHFGLRF